MDLSSGEIGPYRVVGVLARGGMGVVYEAVDADSGQRLAIKVPYEDGLFALDAARREARALRRLRHPGIVTVVDEGVLDGRPWIAMELVDGRSLSSIVPTTTSQFTGGTYSDVTLADPSPSSPPLAVQADPSALGVLRRICDPLAWLHGEGFVHCDLKPANVLLRQDGTPVLVDLGLVARSDGARLPLARLAFGAGTFSYMSPEQIRRDLLDARTDLYALGCVIYEVVTGRPPFVGTAKGILEQHVGVVPAPASRYAPTVDPRLETLLSSMLAKQPEDRPASALDVAAALDDVLGERPANWGPPPRAPRYRPVLAGRAAEIAGLARLVSEGVTVLSAAPGLGRTRLALEVARRWPGKAILCVCQPGGGPLHPLRRALDGDLPDAAGMPHAAGRLRIYEAVVSALSQDPRGTLLVIDDLHCADEVTLGVVRHVAVLRPPGLSVLATTRGEESLQAMEGATLQRLGPLPDAALAELAASVHGRALHDGIRDAIVRLAQGSPLVATEAVRAALLGANVADLDPAALFERRLPEVDSDERQLLATAAVLGRGPVDVLALASGLDDASFEDALRELLLADLLELADSDGAEEVQVVHEGIAATARDAVDGATRSQMHARCAEALIELLPGVWAARRGEHLAAAGRFDEAQAAFAEAAKEAATRSATGEQVSAWRRWLDCDRQPGPKTVQARLSLARVLPQAGRLEEAETEALLAASLAEKGGDLATQVQALATVCYARSVGGREQEALDQWVEIEVLAASGLDPSMRLRMRARRLATEWLIRRQPSLVLDLEEVAAGLERLGDHEGLHHALSVLGACYQHDRRAEAARKAYERSQALARRHGWAMKEVEALGNLGNVATLCAEYEQARAAHFACRQLLRELGNPIGELEAEANLATAESALGHFEAAREAYARARSLVARTGWRRHEGIRLQGEAELLRLSGDYAGGRAVIDELLACADRTGSLRDRVWGLVETGRLALALGHVAEARAAVSEAQAGLSQLALAPEAELPQEVARLAVDCTAFAGGAQLLRGTQPSRLTEGQRARIEQDLRGG